MRLAEFDSSDITTPLKNFAARRRDLALKNAGSGAARGRFNVRLIADKMYHEFTEHLGVQGGQPTNQALAAFIADGWGATRLQQLVQQFPDLAFTPPAAPSQTSPDADFNQATPPPATGSPGPPTGAATPVATSTAPVPAAPAVKPVKPQVPLTAEQNHQLFKRAEKYKKVIDSLLSKPNPNPAQVMTLIARMAKNIAAKGDKQRGWFEMYIKKLNDNSITREAVPQIAQVAAYFNKK